MPSFNHTLLYSCKHSPLLQSCKKQIHQPFTTECNKTMAHTFIHKAWHLIQHAGTDNDEIIHLPTTPSPHPFHIFSRNFTQSELSYYSEFLNRGYAFNNAWLREKHSDRENTAKNMKHAERVEWEKHRQWEKIDQAPEPSGLPQVTVSQGLRDFWAVGEEDMSALTVVDDPGLVESELVYFLLVHGKSGPGHVKVVMRWDLLGAAQAMMWEVANGFSVVFSGAVLKEQLEIGLGEGRIWTKVRSLAELRWVRDLKTASLDASRSQSVRAEKLREFRHSLRVLC